MSDEAIQRKKKEPVYTGRELKKPIQLHSLKFVITGTGRCGTVYLAKLLSSIGIPCGHESIFKYDGLGGALRRIRGEEPIQLSEVSKWASVVEEKKGVTWFPPGAVISLDADSSYMAAPYLDQECLANTAVIHIVRDPMKVINSFVEGFEYFRDDCIHQEHFRQYHGFIYKHVPELFEPMHPLSRAALYYVRWNQMIERLSVGKRYFLYPVERDVHQLFDFLGVQPEQFYQNVAANHKVGLRQVYHSFTDIPVPECQPNLIKELKDMTRRYYPKSPHICPRDPEARKRIKLT